MKKIISTLLILAIMSSFAIISSADTMPELIFDMDLSGCSEGSINVSDASGNSSITSVAPPSAARTPGFGMTEQGTPYLIFDTAGNTTAKASSIDVRFSDLTVPDKDELTFEAWICDVNSDNRKDKYVWSFGQKAGSVVDLDARLKLIGEDTYMTFNTYKISNSVTKTYTANETGLNQYRGQWMHLAVTVDWSKMENSTLYKCEVNFYINGTHVKTMTQDSITRLKYNQSYSYAVLSIGNSANSDAWSADATFPGYIADFKLYDGLLTAKQINDEYLAEGSGYIDPVSAQHTLSDYKYGDKTFDISFDGDIKTDTLGNAFVKDSDGNTLQTEFLSYDEDTMTATYNLNEYPKPGAEYIVSVEGIRDGTGFLLKDAELSATIEDYRTEIAMPAEVVYRDADGEVTTDADKMVTMDVSASVESKGTEPLDFYISVITCDSENRALSMKVSEAVSTQDNPNAVVQITDLPIVKDSTLTYAIWCSAEDGRSWPVTPVTALD